MGPASRLRGLRKIGIHFAQDSAVLMPFHLLVVNADHDRLRATEEILVSAGFLVTCASSFDQAKRGLLAAPPDLLVTDVRLGAYNGLHLVVRAHSDHPSMPAIVMDVHHDQVLESETKNAGAVYVGKPLGAGPLVALVRKLEQEAGPRSSSAAEHRLASTPSPLRPGIVGFAWRAFVDSLN
jgi:two-component system, NtrC family, C4-dicarboxylate transport response regulator DctD